MELVILEYIPAVPPANITVHTCSGPCKKFRHAAYVNTYRPDERQSLQ
jgi:hypothetical protein